MNADGSPRDFYATSVALIGPDLAAATVNLSQVAPGVYEAPVASLGSGAYAVRVTQTKPGDSPLGRTLGLVAPTAAEEYRLLGANEPLLAAIRSATGGSGFPTPAAVWVHDLRTTSRFTDLWPWLLVLALLLWPLDIALRRVSLGRRWPTAGAGCRIVSTGGAWRPGPGRSRGCWPRATARAPPGARTAIMREAAERSGADGGAVATDAGSRAAATPAPAPAAAPAPAPAAQPAAASAPPRWRLPSHRSRPPQSPRRCPRSLPRTP